MSEHDILAFLLSLAPSLARAVISEAAREKLYSARTLEDALSVVDLDSTIDLARSPRGASLADI